MDGRYPVGGPRVRGMVQGVANLLTDAIVLNRRLRGGNCVQYDWIRQATSVWAEHRVYPDVQSEQDRSRHFLDYPAQSLDVGDNARNEGAYLLPFYLQLEQAELALPAMWLQFELKDPLDGIDAALGSVGKKLEDVFPEFAAANWNRKVAGDYWTGDRLSHSAAPADSIVVSIPGTADYEAKLDLGMPYLAAMNYYFKFDPTVKTVTFRNTLGPIRHARVWAIEKVNGSWQKPIDWTQQTAKSWCRSAPGEELDELVLVFSNVQWQNPDLTVDPGPHQPVVSAFTSGCGGWVGRTA
jgi:hypothetical protein